jgi:hypothetical protein
MAKSKGKSYYSGQPECTPYSLSKKSLPGGDTSGVKLSARKVLPSIGGAPSSGDFSLSNKSVKG